MLASTESQTTTCSTPHGCRSKDWDLDDDAIMRVGPARGGQLLEIRIAGIDSEEPVIFHAMECRERFNPYL